MPNENNQIPFETNPSFLDSNKKVLFNINWDLNTGGVRQLELDAFKCLNSNINAVYTDPHFVGSPIDGTTTKSDVTIFFARKRMILLLDIWNRILNSGLFNTQNLFNGTTIKEIKMVGSNLPSILVEYPLKDFNIVNQKLAPVVLDTPSIFYRIQSFLTAYTRNYDNFLITNLSVKSYFRLDNTTLTNTNIEGSVNIYHNPTKPSMMTLIEELVTLCKSLLSETKIASKVDLGFNFDNLTFLTPEGRVNILKLDAYKSNYKEVARIDTSYLNDETKVLAQEWITSNSNKAVRLYPQFGTLISRNTESETWNFRNVAIDTAPYNPLDLNPTMDPALKPYQTRYLLCSQLDMKRPLVFNTQFINWANENDRPYVMLYNGGTLIYIPDEIKESSTLNTLGEQPDNQLNLSAYFWKIGTSNNLDQNYNNTDDIKLKLPDGKNLYDIDKLDFLDNLTIYLKLN